MTRPGGTGTGGYLDTHQLSLRSIGSCQDVVTSPDPIMHVQRIHYWKLVTVLLFVIVLLTLLIHPGVRDSIGELILPKRLDQITHPVPV